MTTQRHRHTLALLVLAMVCLILSGGPTADSASGPAQIKRQPGSVSKPKCRPLGFEFYEKWEKPAALFPFYKDCKLGYVDTRGREVIPPQFDQAGSFYEQLAAVGVSINGKLKYGFINQTGRFVIEPEFDLAHHFSDGLAGVRLGNKSGYIDPHGVVVIPPRFAEVTPFYRGLARVRVFSDDGTSRGKWGCINQKGEFVVPPQHDDIRHFTEQIVIQGIITNEKWKWGLLSWTGTTIREPLFEHIGDFEEGVASMQLEGQTGLININGQMVVSPNFNQAITKFSEGMMAVSIHGRVGYLNLSGEIVIQPEFLSAGAFSEGLAHVKIGDKFGYIDKNGRVVVSPQFDEAIEFSEGLARVRIEGKYGFIDRSGVVKIQPRFHTVTPFRGGAALAWMDDHQGYIDRTGEFIRRWPISEIGPIGLVTSLVYFDETGSSANAERRRR